MDFTQIEYVGEWLLPGNLGHLLTIISLVAAILGTVSYWISAKWDKEPDGLRHASWKHLGRTSFFINAGAILGIIVLMFILILKHRFEYSYIYKHSSLDLPLHYIVSCFWAGQEGSCLLWQFWVAILGIVLIIRSNRWESRVMTVISGMQLFLAAMLIGLFFGEYKIGSSPFALLRDLNPEAPIFMQANYLNFLQDGQGLNPLLQNYWMVIHPPTLFLGFAACLIPFAYCIAALWKKSFPTDWIRTTLKWSLFAGAVLGTGILMGGAWAYESLSFGGFWAWDPVENASLVPWIVLVAGIHTLVVYKNTGRALRITILFLVMAHTLVLYSTFLTRSGILGETFCSFIYRLGHDRPIIIVSRSFCLPACFCHF